MMRLHVSWLVALAACASLLLGAASTSGARATTSSSTANWRTLTLSVSPAPSDVALVEVGFRGTVGRQRISKADLTLAVGSPLGDDYLAVVGVGSAPSRSPRALVLVVNRPSALLDPASVLVRLRSTRALGSAVARRLLDPFTRPRPGQTPALCNIPLHGAKGLPASMLVPVRSRGAALIGFGMASAVAQAYDVACGLPYQPAFARAIGQAGAGACTPVGALCCPPNAICARPPGAPTPAPPAPAPAPPGPAPPACTPCKPPPGQACPLAAPSVCIAPAADGTRRLTTGSD
jgi:hypothetical protein